MSPRSQLGAEGGFAVVVVMLVSAIALLSFLFASATLTVASRSSSAQERASTQALLAADSGLRTLQARTVESPYVSGSLKQWIESNFGTLELGDGIEAELVVVDESVSVLPGEVTVQSTGSAGSSRRVVVQSFVVVAGPPVPLSASVQGALTSVGSIKSNTASALVAGAENTEAAWSQVDVALCTAVPGEYVEYEVEGEPVLYKVVGEPDCAGSMELQQVGTSTPAFLDGSVLVNHRPFAIAEDLVVPGSVSGFSEVDVTDATLSLFGVGTSITIGSDELNGTVRSIDGNTLRIAWDSEPASASYGEGTIVRRHVWSGVTNYECDIGVNEETTFPNECEDDVDLSNLFLKTFGVTQEQLKGSLPDENLLTGSALRDPGRVLEDDIVWLSNPETNVRGQRGSGVIIIEADPGQTVQLNVDNDFIGLIYVIGNARIQGNGEYVGAIIVDGAAELDTAVQGTTDISFDSLAVSRALANLTVPNNTPGGLGAAKAQTWRVR